MKLLTSLTIIATFMLSTGVEGARYRLKTDLKPGQPGKERFSDLYLEAYHTGAGLDDAVMVPNATAGIVGYLNGTVGHSGNITYQNQIFDLGTTFPWSLVMVSNEEFYAGWEPVQVNAGGTESGTNGGFYINETGLQWTSDTSLAPTSTANEFDGWLVCQWWHGLPQLFFRINYPNEYKDYPAPCSCAEVYLCPEYI